MSCARLPNPLELPTRPPTQAEVSTLRPTEAEISAMLEELSSTPLPAARRREALGPSWERIAAAMNSRPGKP